MMTLKELEERLKELRNKGAEDDSVVFVENYYDFSHVYNVEYDENDNSINFYPE